MKVTKILVFCLYNVGKDKEIKIKKLCDYGCLQTVAK